MDVAKVRRCCASSGIYIGNIAAANDIDFLVNTPISLVITLNGDTPSCPESINVISSIIHEQELLVHEYPRMILKLKNLADNIYEARSQDTNVLVCCDSGTNVCMLIVGYYMIGYLGWQPNATIEYLETIYLTSEQRAREKEYEKIVAARLAHDGVTTSADAALAAYRSAKCLTMRSFRHLLRTITPKKS